MRSIWRGITAMLVVELVLSNENAKARLSIVYIYTVVPSECQWGLPNYIKVSLEQAVLSQPDCDIVMASNYAECKGLDAMIDNIPNVIKYDTYLISSNRSIEFANVSSVMFKANSMNNYLWIASAQRFFTMEDYMISKGCSEMIHVEADNLLYGKVSNRYIRLPHKCNYALKLITYCMG
jgi:hypothetical protein